MIKQFKQMLGLAATISSCFAATVYTPGFELADGSRNDIIRVGSAGGFSGYTEPGRDVSKLLITFVASGNAAEPNNVPTFSSYTDTGMLRHLPSTIKDVYLMGDATDFMTLVLGNSAHTYYSPDYRPAAYALPTPSEKTTVHFLLSNAPSTSPQLWFQGPLPAGCRLVIEPGSGDPFINTVLPLAGGKIILGAPVAPEPGFSDLLAGSTGPCPIQRHPKVSIDNAYLKAVMTLPEDTIFNDAVNGISLSGPHSSTFYSPSDLIDPAADSAEAGYIIGERVTLTAYGRHATLPEINANITAGGTSKFVVASTAPKLPTLSPPLV